MVTGRSATGHGTPSRARSGEARGVGANRRDTGGTVGVASPRGVRGQGTRRDHRHLGIDRSPDSVRPRQEVSRDRVHLRRPPRPLRPEGVQRPGEYASVGGTGIHRGADGRHGDGTAFEGVSQRGVEEYCRRRLSRSHSVAPGRRCPIRLLRHHAGGDLRDIRGRTKLDGCAPLPPGVLQGCGVSGGLSRQSDGQDFLERTMDGVSRRPRVRGLVERGPCVFTAGPPVARGRRDGHECRSPKHHASHQRVGEGQQAIRLSVLAGRGPHQRWDLRQPGTQRLLRATSAGACATGLEPVGPVGCACAGYGPG